MIEMKSITKKFNDQLIYKDMTYTFKSNCLTCILGPSGSGKSTLFNMIAGIDQSYKGEIKINNQFVKSLSRNELSEFRYQHIGFVFQDYQLLSGYSVLENIMIASLTRNDEKLKRAEELIDQLGLTDHMHQNVKTLSGGQKQRVAIARALLNDPDIILADEPTGALDHKTKNDIMSIFKEISRSKTIIVITHDQHIAQYSDEVLILDDYKLIVDKSCVRQKIEEQIKVYSKRDLSNKKLFKMSKRNLWVHRFKLLLIVLLVGFSFAAFMGTRGLGEITQTLMDDYFEGNSYYDIVQVNYEDSELLNDYLDELEEEGIIDRVYHQYSLENLKIGKDDNVVNISYKAPTIMSDESLVYGEMPLYGKYEIALPANVARKLTEDVEKLIGKTVSLSFYDEKNQEHIYDLKVSGITNSILLDYIVSGDLEQSIYQEYDKLNSPEMMKFQVTDLTYVSEIDLALSGMNLKTYSRDTDIEVYTKSFEKLMNLYEIIAYIIFAISIIISLLILKKISTQRQREFGLLYVIGFMKNDIGKMVFLEFMLLSVFVCLSSLIAFLGCYHFFKVMLGLSIVINTIMVSSLLLASVAWAVLVSAWMHIEIKYMDIAKSLKSA